jgi:hypothetical protein
MSYNKEKSLGIACGVNLWFRSSSLQHGHCTDDDVKIVEHYRNKIRYGKNLGEMNMETFRIVRKNNKIMVHEYRYASLNDGDTF